MDHVVFALGSLVPPEAEQEPHLDLSLTLQPLLELLGVLAQGPRLPVSYLSSGGTVYGNAPSFPIPETAPTVPVVVYGITRLTAERFVLRYGDHERHRCPAPEASATPTERVRPPPEARGSWAPPSSAAAPGSRSSCTGTGGSARDFVHAEDIGTADRRRSSTPEGPPS